MPLWNRLSTLWRNLARNQRVEDDLNAEIRSYEQMLVDENVRAGSDPSRARLDARLELGGAAQIQEEVREVDAESLENLPLGLDGSLYQWVDLDGEGLSGILTQQANGWFYKRNLSPINIQHDNGKETVVARFAPLRWRGRQHALRVQRFCDERLAGMGDLRRRRRHTVSGGARADVARAGGCPFRALRLEIARRSRAVDLQTLNCSHTH